MASNAWSRRGPYASCCRWTLIYSERRRSDEQLKRLRGDDGPLALFLLSLLTTPLSPPRRHCLYCLLAVTKHQLPRGQLRRDSCRYERCINVISPLNVAASCSACEDQWRQNRSTRTGENLSEEESSAGGTLNSIKSLVVQNLRDNKVWILWMMMLWNWYHHWKCFQSMEFMVKNDCHSSFAGKLGRNLSMSGCRLVCTVRRRRFHKYVL